MVKGVATSIITVAVLMGSLVACGGTTQVVAPASEPEPTVEETPEEVAEPLSTADQFELVKGGVVRLEVEKCEVGGVGTGFLIDENHIVTVAHVVDEAQEILAYVDDEIAIAEVVAIDLDRDLALLRTDIPVGSYYFSLGDFEYRTGDQISVIGFPLGLDLSLTVGTISNEEVSFDYIPLLTFMQIDAPANPGNSGGPVLNADGEVIGIVDWQISDAQGLNFAISVDSVDRIFSSWVDNTPISLPACGSQPATEVAAPSTGNGQSSSPAPTPTTRPTTSQPPPPQPTPTPTPTPAPAPAPEPQAPTNVSASVNGNTIYVSWDPPPYIPREGSKASAPKPWSRGIWIHVLFEASDNPNRTCSNGPVLTNYTDTELEVQQEPQEHPSSIFETLTNYSFSLPTGDWAGNPFTETAIQNGQVTLRVLVNYYYETQIGTEGWCTASNSFTIPAPIAACVPNCDPPVYDYSTEFCNSVYINWDPIDSSRGHRHSPPDFYRQYMTVTSPMGTVTHVNSSPTLSTYWSAYWFWNTQEWPGGSGASTYTVVTYRVDNGVENSPWDPVTSTIDYDSPCPDEPTNHLDPPPS